MYEEERILNKNFGEKEERDNPNPLRGFKGIWIPREIWLDKRLSNFEKLLWAEIDSLDNETHCTSSNKYFCEFFSTNLRTIQSGISKLKSLGYIQVVSFDGRKRSIKSNFGQKISHEIFDTSGLKPKTSHEIFDTPPVRNLTPHQCQISHVSPIGDFIERDNKDYNKVYKKRERESASPPPPFKFKRVFMDQDKKEKLLQDLGKSKFDEMLERLDEYADINPKRFKQYACHATVIRKWHREDKSKGYKSVTQPHRVEFNKAFMARVAEKFPNHPHIKRGGDAAVFSGGETHIEIKFSDFSFQEQVIHRLRKMGLGVKDLEGD